MNRARFQSAAARLSLDELAIVVGLLRAEARDLAARGRLDGARELERVGRELLETKTRLEGALVAARPIDSWAVVVSEQRRPMR